MTKCITRFCRVQAMSPADILFKFSGIYLVLLGLGLVFENKKYETLPQAHRLTQLCGIGFIGFGILSWKANPLDATGDLVAPVVMLFILAFALLVGPLRKDPPNKHEVSFFYISSILAVCWMPYLLGAL
eukprot:TRINITY_DN3211_c0_g1_i5.p1 TRINITY_DN3211_c0_g1~~TRINITY_DN3211_c0_g1_i5.p1  ORF type:complete len:129 (+),score=8.92 TRINITY_DN3211_c0_g1_i5:113-499(+)